MTAQPTNLNINVPNVRAGKKTKVTITLRTLAEAAADDEWLAKTETETDSSESDGESDESMAKLDARMAQLARKRAREEEDGDADAEMEQYLSCWPVETVEEPHNMSMLSADAQARVKNVLARNPAMKDLIDCLEEDEHTESARSIRLQLARGEYEHRVTALGIVRYAMLWAHNEQKRRRRIRGE